MKYKTVLDANVCREKLNSIFESQKKKQGTYACVCAWIGQTCFALRGEDDGEKYKTHGILHASANGSIEKRGTETRISFSGLRKYTNPIILIITFFAIYIFAYFVSRGETDSSIMALLFATFITACVTLFSILKEHVFPIGKARYKLITKIIEDLMSELKAHRI